MENKLAYFRKRAYMTQAKASKGMGVCQSMISKWEKDKAKMDVDQAYRMAELYGCSIDELMGRAEPAYKPAI